MHCYVFLFRFVGDPVNQYRKLLVIAGMMDHARELFDDIMENYLKQIDQQYTLAAVESTFSELSVFFKGVRFVEPWGE